MGKDRGLVAGLTLVVLLVAGTAALSWINPLRVYDAERQVAHTHEVLTELERTLSSMSDAESGQRGYLITGEAPYLEPYRAGAETIRGEIERLDALTRDNPRQQARIRRLRELVTERLDLLEIGVRARAERGFQGARQHILTDRGSRTMDALRDHVRQMEDEEHRLLAERVPASLRSRNLTIASGTVAAVLALAMVGAVAGLFQRTLRDRARSADLLHAEKELFRTTLASIGDAVITTDTEGRVTSLNPVAEALTGWSARDADGAPLDRVFRIVNEETRAAVENPALRALRDDTIVGLANHTMLIARDGSERPIDDSAAPIRDAAGRRAGVVLVFRDIAERRNAERQLREADRRKDEFLAVLSHELRNPLAPLRNALEAMRISGYERGAAERAAGIMDRQLGLMVRLVDDLLDVSRITNDRPVIQKERVDVADLMRSAAETAEPMLREKRIELALELPAEPVPLHADRIRLAQAIFNLLSNACKYSETGGRVSLRAERRGNEVVVRVRDDGIGIPAHMRETIFELFHQVDATLEASQSGLGIGLTLVKGIVEAHGGTVVAESEGAGRGSEFTIRLPVSEAAPAGAPETAKAEPQGAALRILVADDNADSADSLAMVLRMRGHDVRTARDGLEAVECAEAFRPDVVLLDIGMPKLDGYGAARRIRRQPWGRGIRLVALTGYGQTEHVRRARDEGFDRHLVKPVELAALERALGDPPAS